MKNISTGFGLCAIAAAVALYPVLDRFAPIGKEAHAGIPVSAITSAALAQSAPTIVWYGTNAYTQVIGSGTGSRQSACGEILRGWSDGRVEVMTTRREIERLRYERWWRRYSRREDVSRRPPGGRVGIAIRLPRIAPIVVVVVFPTTRILLLRCYRSRHR